MTGNRVALDFLYSSPYLDRKYEEYLSTHPDASVAQVLRYLQSFESDASLFLNEIEIKSASERPIDTFSLVGRESELRMLDIFLNRKYKNNVILVGEPGVGKTTLIRSYFKKKRIAIEEVSTSALVAGTKYRGEFESKLNEILENAQNDNSVVFFDEIHTLVGAGAAEGGISAVNILKPVITSRNLRVIGATTPAEVHTLLEDAAFRRRFSFLTLREPADNALRAIAENFLMEWDSPHIEESVFAKIKGYLDETFPSRRYPDKLIDFLDFWMSARSCLAYGLEECMDLFCEVQAVENS